tara:strand:- start:2845 stop:2982 length:138 start_codon:yes stop_codon:yes gene_type:complete
MMKNFKEYKGEEDKEEKKEEDTMPSEYEPTAQDFYAEYIKKTTQK